MANHYLQFSEIIELEPAEVAWWKSRLDEMWRRRDEDMDYDLPAEFKLEEDPTGTASIWIHADEGGDPEAVGELVREFFKACRPAGVFSLTWASWCSKPRIGEFGGGGLRVTADRIVCMSAGEAVHLLAKLPYDSRSREPATHG